MGVLDLERLLAPVSADSPCGNDTEYDPEFAEMLHAAQGEPERQFGATIVEAVPANWIEVKRLSLSLAERTKDVRIASYLARALLSENGFSGFREALKLFNGYIETYWSAVHPLLDPDDDNDPTIRVNAIKALVDPATTLILVRMVPIVSARSVGRFCFRDFQIARGDISAPPSMTAPPKMSAIEGAIQACDLKELSETCTAVEECGALARELERRVTEQTGAGSGPDLAVLVKELVTISKLMRGWLNQRGYSEGSTNAEAVPAAAVVASDAPAVQQSGRTGSASGEITCRREAIEALDRVCQWFERYEPSSPLPLLLKRAKRLSSKSFLEILRDITPEGLTQAKALGFGANGEEEEAAVSEPPAPVRGQESRPAPNPPARSSDGY